jgi:ankyrin repeat protein
MGAAMDRACQGGDVETIGSLLDAGKSVNSVDDHGWTPIMVALINGQLHVAIMLAGRGADLSRVSNSGLNVLRCAAIDGNIDCIEWVLANTSIDVNSTTNIGGWTPIINAVNHGHLDAGKLLVEKGANLFMKNNDGESAIDSRVDNEPDGDQLGPQVLQHAKDLIWESVKPLLLLSSACSTSIPSSSLIKVFSISGLVRDYIAPYIMRKGLIIRDPEEDVDEEPEPDEVKLRIEAALAAASSSSSSSSSVKRA